MVILIEYRIYTLVLNIRVLKSYMRCILRYYEDLIWSKYWAQIPQGEIFTDFIWMDVRMFPADLNIHLFSLTPSKVQQ